MRRNTKTMYEWRKAYRDKEELMLERGFPEVSPHEFYRDLFPEGSLQSAEHDGKIPFSAKMKHALRGGGALPRRLRTAPQQGGFLKKAPCTPQKLLRSPLRQRGRL